ncbi:hypothetical protein C8R48DRAFT_782741 [Suillus tomentosus]|nr:hypothetical protein C8R48DRAFT_782741 [Suillus tomentosus]
MILQVDNGEVCNGAGWEVEDVNPTCLHLRTCALIRLLLYLPAGPAPHTCVHVPALHTAVVSLAVTRSDVPAWLQAPGQPKPGLIEPGQAKAQLRELDGFLNKFQSFINATCCASRTQNQTHRCPRPSSLVELEELDDAELEAGSDSKAAGDDGDEDSWDAMLDDAEDDADDEADESDFEMDN